MSEPHKINAKVNIPNKSNTPPLKRKLTLEMICEWIRLQELDEYTTEELIKMAGRYPSQALPSFRKNFNLMIQRARQNRKKETNVEINKELMESLDENKSEERTDTGNQCVESSYTRRTISEEDIDRESSSSDD